MKYFRPISKLNKKDTKQSEPVTENTSTVALALAGSRYNETTCGVQAVKLGFGQKVIAYTYFKQSDQVKLKKKKT